MRTLEKILWSEVGTKQDYEAEYGQKPLGEFVREIVGLDMNAAKAAFAQYLDDTCLDSRQIYFVNQIVEYICLLYTSFLVAASEYLRDRKKQEVLFDRQNKEHYMNHMFHGYDMDRTCLLYTSTEYSISGRWKRFCFQDSDLPVIRRKRGH